MKTRELSPREKEIVELSCAGLTNEAIAFRLGLSVGTVNTYWLRIKLKTGGTARTETIANIFKERAERAVKQERVDWDALAAILAKREISDVITEQENGLQLRTTLALLQLAMDHIQATVWATDRDLSTHMMVNGEPAATRFGAKWEEGSTVYELFNTADKSHPAVAAHLAALAGSPSDQRLRGEFADLFLSVIPLVDESDEVIGCISILNRVGE